MRNCVICGIEQAVIKCETRDQISLSKKGNLPMRFNELFTLNTISAFHQDSNLCEFTISLCNWHVCKASAEGFL